jgi:hypothetical protein
MPTINFNGKTYNSIDEMPADVRETYQHLLSIFKDENANGIPDFMEGDIAKNIMTAFSSSSSFNVNLNGKVYTNMNDLPPETKEKVQKALERLKASGLLPDANLLQGSAASASSNFEPAFQPSKPMFPQEAAIQESGGRNWLLILTFLAATLICAVAVALAIYFMR